MITVFNKLCQYLYNCDVICSP